MSWKLACRKTRRSMALWCGNDLDPADQVVAQRHLTVCPDCREHWQRLQSGQQALELSRATPEGSAPLSASVWPAVERQIRAGEERRETADWRGWLPTGALVAACLTVVLRLPWGELPYTDGGSGASIARVPFSQPVTNAPVWRLDHLPQFDRQQAVLLAPLGVPETMRVRTLLDGTDIRGSVHNRPAPNAQEQ